MKETSSSDMLRLTPRRVTQEGLRVRSLARLQGTPAWPTIQAIHGLLRKGDERDEMNIPFRGKSRIEAVVDEFIRRYAFTGNDVLDRNEAENAAKVRPFTRLPFKLWRNSYVDYYKQVDPTADFEDALYEAALAYMKANDYQFGLGRNSLEDVVKRMRKGTNLGMPYLTSSPNAWNGPIFHHYLSKARRILAGNRVRLEPYFMFWRIQQGKRGEMNKHRVVWGADHTETIAMLAYLYPVLDANSEKPGFRAFTGVKLYRETFARTLEEGTRKGYVWVSGDVSRKDQSTSPTHVKASMRIWKDMVPEVAAVSDLMYDYYTAGELITPDGIISGLHGRPSGIVPTGLFNTWDMMAAVSLFWLSKGLNIGDLIAEFHGDDFFFSCPEELVDDFWPFMSTLGWEVNPEKSLTHPSIINYLQRYWTPQYDGYYSLSRVIARLMYSERVQPSYNYETKGHRVERIEADTRMLMLQMYSKLENASAHPNFRTLVRFIGSLDRYSLNPAMIGSRWKLREVLNPYTHGTPANDVGLQDTATYRAVVSLRREGKLTFGNS